VRERPLVIKFGGTSVGDGDAFLRAANIAADAARERPVAVVVSAMAGTTDALLGVARATVQTTSGEASRTPKDASREGVVREVALSRVYRALADRHLRAAREAVRGELLPEVEGRIHEILWSLIEAVDAPAENLAARGDAIVSLGERLSACILAGAMSGLGAPAAVASADPIATDGGFGEAEVLARETRSRAQKYVRPLLEEGTVAVVPGYVGSGPDAAVTTLGRGGSDLTATVLGRALGSEEVWILSDVNGVLDADPDLIPSAALIPRLSYREAGQFASLGAKVLHPRTTEPASAAGIEVRIRSTFNPSSEGTLISYREGGPGVRSVALRRGLTISHAPPEIVEDAFCVLGADDDGLKVLTDGAGLAAVVCIGAPTDRDLLAGLRCLREVNVRPLFAGNASTGLLFAVAEEDAETTLHALHAGLIPAATLASREEVA
jgi:aspartate kinase